MVSQTARSGHPAEASTVVDCRYRTRAGARRNAERTGYEGRRYAWESALDGDEVTPTWAETGRLEQHVTADVALAARAARLLGLAVPARWSEVAGGLAVLEPTPLDGLPAVRPEFRAYAGQQVKQADVVLLTYPWEFPSRPRSTAPTWLLHAPLRPRRAGHDRLGQQRHRRPAGDRLLGLDLHPASLDPFVKAPYEQF